MVKDILEILQEDYRQFPHNQTYSLYAQDVYFQDPLTRFRGLDRYRQMIGFIQTWFLEPHLDLHKIEREHDRITTSWSLSWTTPLPWKPRITILGWSEMTLNSEELIISHIDYWSCSPWNVVRQHLPFS
ncbi:hypothetical protein BST81_09910 [Leptolyngbya sp. 'hensonii']|uniref:DUF2358 domain-containing protein n=1 Tax=Leptolyngbya sp. 'hensonii' TaxID=1922337 RepID=UPI000950115B|nr:DUF2358 domain-containing protein [Leptolyngbya sp. 'hensonii']OLP18595.1 hypothetical protein BST81_09910 [Leptolyngbya sp. 'hensonii']